MARKRNTARGAKRKAFIKKHAKGFAIHALTGGMSAPFQIAKKLLKKNKKKMQKFVESEGIEPSENLDELAVQTAGVRTKKIQDIVKDDENYPDVQDEDTAEEVFEQEQEEQGDSEGFDDDSDSFTGAALGAILGVAKGVVNKVKEGRLAKGKKFMGKTKAQWDAKGGMGATTDGNGNIVLSGLSNKNSKDGFSMAVNDAKKGVMDDTLKKVLPFIILGLVVLLFGKKLFK